MNRILALPGLLALLLVLAVFRQWEIIPALAREPMSVPGIIVFVHLALSFASLVGLLRGRSWGFYAFYATVLYGTIVLSMSFIPLPLDFLPAERRWIGLSLLNAAVLIVCAVCHRWHHQRAVAIRQKPLSA